MAESLPIHVMSGPDLIARYMKETHPTLRAGDAFLHNSPYHGNSHAADWCVVIPVIDGDGVHHYTVIAKAHLADCGNAVPTTYVADATDVYNEGALIFPCVKVQEDYRGPRRRAAHGPRPHPRPRPLARRLPGAPRRGPDRRTPPPRTHRRDGQRIAQDLRARLVRLQRATDDRGDQAPARRDRHTRRTPRPDPRPSRGRSRQGHPHGRSRTRR